MEFLKQLDHSGTGMAYDPTDSLPPCVAFASDAHDNYLVAALSHKHMICNLDFKSEDSKMSPFATFQTPAVTRRISWGRASARYPFGLAASGFQDGRVCIWNPDILIKGLESKSLYLVNDKAHNGPVCGLEFSTLEPLLASGAGDGLLKIWDLRELRLKGSELKGNANGEISYLSWNRNERNILATTSCNGTAVWHQNNKSPIMRFQNPLLRRACSSMQWNPVIANEFVAASPHGECSSLRLWDTRKSKEYLHEFKECTEGVIAMSWSATNKRLITCSRDGRNILWDIGARQIAYEFPPALANRHLDVQWCPQRPEVISTCSSGGQIYLYDLQTELFGKELFL